MLHFISAVAGFESFIKLKPYVLACVKSYYVHCKHCIKAGLIITGTFFPSIIHFSLGKKMIQVHWIALKQLNLKCIMYSGQYTKLQFRDHFNRRVEKGRCYLVVASSTWSFSVVSELSSFI